MRSALAVVPLGLFIASPACARIDAADLASLAFRQHPGAELPLPASFRDASGRTTTLAQAIAGRPSILILEYLRCRNLCNLVLSGAASALVRAHLSPGDQVNLVAISIDPRDTPQSLAAAASAYSRRFPNPAVAAQGIRFLSGSPDTVQRVADAVGFPYRLDAQSGQYAHPAGFVVTTANGRISRYMLGLNPSASDTAEAIAAARAGRIRPPVHPLLCLCFGYDPDEGSVAALTWRLVQWVSLSIAIGCAALVGLLSVRRRPA